MNQKTTQHDAIGSFAIQIALLIGVLTYARALRLLDDPAQEIKTRLILRGNSLVLFTVWVTLIVDAVAEVVSQMPLIRPLPSSYWGDVLLVEPALMFLLALICTIALTVVFKRIEITAPPRDLTPADGIDDL